MNLIQRALIGGTSGPKLYASPNPASVVASPPQGRILFAVPNVPTGVTATVSPNDGRFAVIGTGTNTVITAGASAISAGVVNVTVSAAGIGSVIVPVNVVAVPTALLTAASAMHSLFRLNTSYAGAACQVQAVSDNPGTLVGTPFDVAFDGAAFGAHIDFTSMYATAVTNGGLSDRVRVIQVYDQQVGAKHLTTPNTATQTGPWMMKQYQRNGIQPISFRGNRNWATANTADGPDNQLIIPTNLALARANFAFFMGCVPHWSRNLSNFIVFGQASASFQMRLLPGTGGFNGLAYGVSGNYLDTGIYPRSQESVLGYSSTASDQRAYLREQEIQSLTPQSATTMASGGYIGSSGISAQSTSTVEMEWYGISWHAGQTSANSLTMYNFWVALTNAPTQFTSRYITDGDSIEQEALGTRDNYGVFQITRRQLIGNPELYNLAISGIKYFDAVPANASILNLIANDISLYSSSLRTIYKVRAGTNDAGGGQTGSAIYGYATSYANQLKALGSNVRVAIATFTPLVANAAPGIFAALAIANSAGAAGVVDYTTTGPGSIGTGAENNLTWYPPALTTTPTTPDIHPGEVACALMAPVDISVINGLLAGTV